MVVMIGEESDYGFPVQLQRNEGLANLSSEFSAKRVSPGLMLTWRAFCAGWVSSPPLEKLPPQLEMVIAQIKACLRADLSYPALLTALTIPEICMGLQLNVDQFLKRMHYREFIDKYTTTQDLGFTGDQCYNLRGGIVHRGSATGHMNTDVEKIMFIPPNPNVTFHGTTFKYSNVTGKAYSLVRFCLSLEIAARLWYADNCKDPKVVNNIRYLLTYQEDALKPFDMGLPVAALVSGPAWD